MFQCFRGNGIYKPATSGAGSPQPLNFLVAGFIEFVVRVAAVQEVDGVIQFTRKTVFDSSESTRHEIDQFARWSFRPSSDSGIPNFGVEIRTGPKVARVHDRAQM